MKIAVFYADSLWVSWSLGRGLPAVLRRMGHDVTAVPILPTARVTRAQYEKAKAEFPTVEALNQHDAVLFSGPEHLKDWVLEFLSIEQLKAVTAPKIGWHHGSLNNSNFENFRPWIDRHFMADPGDAERYGGEWLAAGVDCEVFDSETLHGRPKRDIPCASIARMTDNRQDFLKALTPLLKGFDFRVGNCVVQGLDGIDIDKSTELLSDALRRSKVFLHLPQGTNVVPALVLEAMACGAYTIRAKNEAVISIFGKNCSQIFDAGKPERAAKAIKEALEYDTVRASVARQQCEEVHKNHRLEVRLEKILEAIDGNRKPVQSELAQQPA